MADEEQNKEFTQTKVELNQRVISDQTVKLSKVTMGLLKPTPVIRHKIVG